MRKIVIILAIIICAYMDLSMVFSENITDTFKMTYLALFIILSIAVIFTYLKNKIIFKNKCDAWEDERLEEKEKMEYNSENESYGIDDEDDEDEDTENCDAWEDERLEEKEIKEFNDDKSNKDEEE